MIVNSFEIKPGAILGGADLSGASLYGADLSGASLHGADLSDADLCKANLRGASLYGADLRGANLRGANLHNANLYSANLHNAILCGANLRGANLGDADLSGANLKNAELNGAKDFDPYVAAQLNICPEGELIVYKRVSGNSIITLRIPAEAKRSNATGRKCRAEFAFVIEGEGHSNHDQTFAYAPGVKVVPTEPFDENRWRECSSGIHFFLTRIEAEMY